MIIDIKDIDTYYINMDKDTEKNNQIINTIEDAGIKNFKRIPGVDAMGNRAVGCASSHYNTLSKIKKPSLILEDDCLIFKKNLEIEIPDDADAVYLGISEWGYTNGTPKIANFNYSEYRGMPNIRKIDGMLSTHAILYLNKEYISVCKNIAKYSLETACHIDVGFAEIQKFYNVYALQTPIFYQSNNIKATKIRLHNKKQVVKRHSMIYN